MTGPISNTSSDAAIIAGANTGVKGQRVYIGPTDPISDLPVYMDYDHHQIHDGEAFRWSVYTASLGNAANKDIRLVVPNIVIPAGVPVAARAPHLRFEMVASDTCQLFLYEGTTFTANGSQRAPVAMERNGTYTPQLQVWEDPTVNVIGTKLFEGIAFSGRSSVGAIDKAYDEFVLKINTSYHIRCTSSAAGNKVLLRVVWYEDLGV